MPKLCVPIDDSAEVLPMQDEPSTGCRRLIALLRNVRTVLACGAVGGGVLWALLGLASSSAVSRDSGVRTSCPSESGVAACVTACIPAAPSMRSAGRPVPVASQETPEETRGDGESAGMWSRFDEQCRPLSASVADADVAALPTPASSGDSVPTPASPELARRESHRYVLMVEVEAQHGSNTRD